MVSTSLVERIVTTSGVMLLELIRILLHSPHLSAHVPMKMDKELVPPHQLVTGTTVNLGIQTTISQKGCTLMIHCGMACYDANAI